MEKYGNAKQTTDDDMIRRMRVLSFIIKAPEAHSEYVIRIVVQRQQWLGERTSLLSYT